MRSAAFLSSLLVLGLLAPFPAAGPSDAEAREWVVSCPEDLADQVIYLEENLTIATGGRLALDNVSLRFNSTEGSPLVLEVLAGGELELRNSSLDSNGSGAYLVRAHSQSRLIVSGCTIDHAGTCATVPALSGFLIEAGSLSIRNSTFRYGAAGIYLLDVHVVPAYCQFIGNEIGAVVDGCGVGFQHCRFDGQTDRDLVLLNGSNGYAYDSDLQPSGVFVEDSASSFLLEWPLSVTVTWDDGRPASGAIVTVTPTNGSVYLRQANDTGMVFVLVDSYLVLQNGTQYRGPFNITAESEGKSAWNVTDIDGGRDIYLTLDGTPPEINIDYPPAGARLNGTPPPASGAAWDPYPRNDSPGISLVEARLDDGPWAPANGTGSWSFGLAGLSEGVHTLTVRAWDFFNNSNQSSISFEVDLSPPALEVWPPAGYLSAARNITARITTDGVVVLFNGTPVPGLEPGRPLELDWPLELEGNNTAAVESLDAAGNTARQELLVVRDTIPPKVVFTFPPAYSVLNTSLVTLTGQSSDLHGIVLVEWGLDRENWTRADGTSEWSFPAILNEGPNTVYVMAMDGAGNTATGWLRLDVRLPDTAPPEVRILYPENGLEVASPSLDVTVRATDAGGIRSVRLNLDGADWTDASGPGDWTGRLTLALGNNTIRARAEDLSGNANSTSVVVVYTPPPPDTTPPALEILYPPAGLKVTYSKTVVSGRASDPSGVSSVEVSADGKNWSRCILTGEEWSGTVTLSPGKNTILVRATDGLGNQAPSSTVVEYLWPADPAAERTTFVLLLVLVMLALLAVWLLVRAPPGRRQGSHRPGHEEE